MVPPPPSLFYVPATNPPHPPAPKPAVRAKAPKKVTTVEEPPTLSGFKKLRSLAVLDIDTLDVVTELKTCVRNSAGSLVKLKLSFSDSLAMQARKPPPDMDPEDSDPEDEFQVVPVQPAGPSYNDEVSGPARAFRAQEERKSQEAVLGRIFDVEPYIVKKAHKKPRDKDASNEESSANPSRDFIEAIKLVSAKLSKNVHGTSDFTTAQQEVLNMIEAAARKYVASDDAKPSDKKIAGSSAEASTSQTKQEVKVEEPATEAEPSVSLFDQPSPSRTKEGQKDADPDDINIEDPEEELSIEPQDSQTNDPPTPAPEPTTAVDSAISQNLDKAATTLAAQKVNFLILVEKLDNFKKRANSIFKDDGESKAADGCGALERAEEWNNITQDIQELRQEMKTVVDEIRDVETVAIEVRDAEKQAPAGALVDPEAQNQKMSDYLRTTRGLALQSLSVHLIPVKASVLSRAIDLRMLRRLTLLNVGPQAAIWTHLQKENKESPLPLRKIYTDNVTQAFLTCVSQLEEVHELFLLERDNKYKPEPFAPKTVITIEQIRRIVLKKHMPTLKRLMIKHQSDTAWDMNEKTVMLICKRGKNLQELACNMGIKVVVRPPSSLIHPPSPANHIHSTPSCSTSPASSASAPCTSSSSATTIRASGSCARPSASSSTTSRTTPTSSSSGSRSTTTTASSASSAPRTCPRRTRSSLRKPRGSKRPRPPPQEGATLRFLCSRPSIAGIMLQAAATASRRTRTRTEGLRRWRIFTFMTSGA